jgi:hypothetical protein
MTNSTKKYKIISVLGKYNLECCGDFPTCINPYSTSPIDNSFLVRSWKNLIIIPNYNGLSDHDVLMLTPCNPSYKFVKFVLVGTGRHCDDPSVREFKSNLSY